MPHYFFRYRDKSCDLLDEVGEVFDGPAKALSHAWQVASELARNADRSTLLGCAIIVEDENGRQLFEVDVSAFSENVSLRSELLRP
jgi:hypothetical protein